MKSPDSKPPVSYLQANQEIIGDIAEELLQFDTQNPPGNTQGIIKWLEDYLATLNVSTDRHVVDPAKPNLIARLPGVEETVLSFNGHVDTVPYEGSIWEYDPLGERDGERIYGRGATDMKGAMAAMVATLQAYVDTDTTPPVTLEFVFVSDEEVGGDAGLPALLAADRLDADGCVIGEPTCERGNHSVTIADRGSIWLTLSAEGKASHGSRPMLGVNAIDRLYDGIEVLRDRFGTRPLDFDAAMEPIIEESVQYYAPLMDEATVRGLFDYPTINLGTLSGGEAINSVPQTATAEIDIRLTAGVDTRSVFSDIRACAADCEGVEITDVSWSVGTMESIDSPLVEAVATVAEEVAGSRVYRRSATGGGDAKKLRNAGIPTVEFAFGTDTAHGVDEFITLEALYQNAVTYARLPYVYQ